MVNNELTKTEYSGYRITLEGKSDPFVDLVDVLRSYEATAATLIDKQRDHFIHSVNVFLCGLAIWVSSKLLNLFTVRPKMKMRCYFNLRDNSFLSSFLPLCPPHLSVHLSVAQMKAVKKFRKTFSRIFQYFFFSRR